MHRTYIGVYMGMYISVWLVSVIGIVCVYMWCVQLVLYMYSL